MIIGIPKEIKNNEFRVALTPAGAHTLLRDGHSVLVETEAGLGSGFLDSDYISAGALVINNTDKLYKQAELIAKVKEPLDIEFDRFRPGQILFTYLHLAPNKPLTEALINHRVTAIAYETVTAKDGSLPLLIPMSEVAGRMAAQVGSTMLQKSNSGSGILMGGVPGVLPAKVLIIGGGIVGTNAARIASGMGADVIVMDINKSKLDYLDEIFMGRIKTLLFSEYAAREILPIIDLLIGAVLIPGAKAPRIVTEDMVKTMKKGSVIVDVAIDQGGSIETIDRITTHDNPCYLKHGIVHYSVANMPGAVPRTSTLALTGATLPYIRKLAENPLKDALMCTPGFVNGLNVYNGLITNLGVADSYGAKYYQPENALLQII